MAGRLTLGSYIFLQCDALSTDPHDLHPFSVSSLRRVGLWGASFAGAPVHLCARWLALRLCVCKTPSLALTLPAAHSSVVRGLPIHRSSSGIIPCLPARFRRTRMPGSPQRRQHRRAHRRRAHSQSTSAALARAAGPPGSVRCSPHTTHAQAPEYPCQCKWA